MSGPKIVDFKVFSDHRGSLYKFLGKNSVEEHELGLQVADSYIAESKQFVFRGLHMQKEPFAQTKCFFAIKGIVRIIAIYAPDGNIVQDSLSTFEIDEASDSGVFVPKNWATGVLTLSERSVVWSTSNKKYVPRSEIVIPASSLERLRLPENVIISDKDKNIK